MKWFAGIALAISLIGTSAYAQSTDIKADIQTAANDWMNAYNNKDAATIANMYAEDGIFSNTNWTASGRTAIADAPNKEFALGVKFTAITVDQSQRDGDMAYSRGTWAADATGPDGKNVSVNGHWLTIGKCQGQTCLITVHNGNTAMPPPK
jgi:uncharacterized protein (TIGR02246 family)